MKSIKLIKGLLTFIVCLTLGQKLSAQSLFSSGNLVVLQTSGTASKASSAVTLKEITPSGTPGMSVTIPSTGPTPFQSAGIFGGSEGFLTTSSDGKYLVLGGYLTSATISDITATSSASVPRVMGIVYPSGFYLQIDSSNKFYSVNDIRGGISDGTNFWASGASNATDGINYFGPGSKAGLGASATPPKAYGLRIFNGQIYYSTQKAGPTNTTSQLGIFALGSGMPTSGTISVNQIINTGTAIPQDFSFNPNGDTCYIAINLNTALGGIQKWAKNGSSWSLLYTLGTGVTNIGAYGLVVDYSGANPVIYATTFDAAGNRVIKIIDKGKLTTAITTTLVSATTNVYYKGIAFAPVASGLPLVNLSISKDTASEAGKSVVTITANASSPVSGNQTVSLAISGTGITSGDYSLTNSTITLFDGTTSGSVTFTVKDDILGEGKEVVDLKISSPSSGIILGKRVVQSITINDNDGNNRPTIAMNVNKTTNSIDGETTTPPASPFKLSGAVSDPTDPASKLGVDFIINDLETFSGNLSIAISSSNTSVVPNSGINFSGADTFRNIKITPSGVGYSNIRIRVSDGTDSTFFILAFASSATSKTPSNTLWHTGISDASDAIALDDNYYLTGDDELNLLNVYSRSASGLPVISYNYTSNLSLPDPGKPEVDLEAATPSMLKSKRIYWLGSMSNGKDPFDDKPNRDRIFATTYSGTGSSTSFSFSGYATLRSRILSWGDANGYSFTASAAAGVDSKLPNGFAAEGMVFGPDSTTLYIGFRAPLVPKGSRTKAVIAPIKNFETWFNNGSPSGNPSFGNPIELNLGGRGIRDLIRLSNGTYIIVAGNSGSDPIIGAIYTWSGYAIDAPIPVKSSASDSLNMEGAMQVNSGGKLSLTSLQVITDKGADVLYNDGTEAKEFGDLIYRKFRSDNLTSIDLSNPEITLWGNNILINDGDVTPNTAYNTDFGNVNLLSSGTNKFVIQNTGNATLSVSGINFSGTNSADFSLVNPPSFPLSIGAGSSQTISVKFTPTAAGSRLATFNISSNDFDEATYDVALAGNGVCASPSIPTLSASSLSNCGTKSTSLNISGGLINSATNWQWYSGSCGGTSVGSGTKINVSPTITTTYFARGEGGCVTAGSCENITITVNPNPIAAFTVSNHCLGNAVNFSNQSIGATTSLWDFGDGKISALNSPTYTYASVGNYTVKLGVTTANGCKDSIINTVTVFPKPTVSFNATPNSICRGGLMTFTNTTTNGSTYNWNFGNGTVSTSTNPTNSYNTAGNFNVKLAATSTNGCKDSTTKSVSILPRPSAGFTVNNGCINDNLSFVSSSIGSVTHAWTFGDATTSSASNPSKAYSTAGTFNVQLIITSSNGCSDTAISSITSYPRPAASFTSSGTECADHPAIFTNTSTLSSGYMTYQWNFGDGNKSGATSPSNTFIAGGTYTVVLTTTSNKGCSASAGSNFVVNSKPLANFNALSVCQGVNVVFNNISIGGSSYSWDFGDAVTSNLSSPTHSYSNAGIFNIKLTVSNATNCSDVVTKQVVIFDNPVANFTATDRCLGLPISFANSSTGVNDLIWQFGDGNSSGYTYPNYTYKNSGTYTVTLVVKSMNGCLSSVAKSVSVFAKPNVTFSVNNRNQCLNGNSFTYTDNTTIATGTFNRFWSLGNGSNSTVSSNVISYSGLGNYNIKLVATSNNGCKDSSSDLVKVYPKPIANFSINNANQCFKNHLFVFTDASSIASGSLGRSWNLGNTLESNGTIQYKNYSTADTYTIKLFVNSEFGCMDSIIKTITLNPSPTADFAINNDFQCVNGNNFIFTNNSSGVIFNSVWKFGDGSNSIASNSSKTYALAGIYTVVLKVNTAFGCSDSSNSTVNILNNPSSIKITGATTATRGSSQIYSVPYTAGSTYNWVATNGKVVSNGANMIQIIWNTVGTNGSVQVTETAANGCIGNPANLNVALTSSAAVQSVNRNTFAASLYPNPTKDNFTITVSTGDMVNMRIYDHIGKKVMADIKFNTSITVSDHHLTAGIYTIRLTDAKGNNTILRLEVKD